MNGNKINSGIAERLGRLRVEHGETQQSLAAALNVSREAVKFWESGDRQIKASDLARIAQHYNVSADYLLGLSPAKAPDSTHQAACIYTGLSDEAICSLTEIKGFEDWISVINVFLSELAPRYAYRVMKLIDAVDFFRDRFPDVIAPDNGMTTNEKLHELQILQGALQLAAFGFAEMCRDLANHYSVYDCLDEVDGALFALSVEAKGEHYGEHKED